MLSSKEVIRISFGDVLNSESRRFRTGILIQGMLDLVKGRNYCGKCESLPSHVVNTIIPEEFDIS